MIMLNKMSKKNILFVGLAISALCMTSCSKQPDFDAKSYVQSSLDAEYHEQYADYANLMEISEEDVKKQVVEDFNESIRQQFASSDNITRRGNCSLHREDGSRLKKWRSTKGDRDEEKG